MKKVMIAAAFVFCAAAVSMAQSANGNTDEKKAPSELVTGVEADGKTKKCDKAEKEKCTKKGKKDCDKKKPACHDKKAAVIDRKRNSKRLV